MDYPKSVPGSGLVDGKFVDEDAIAGTPGSLIPASWGNSVTQEILGAITAAGLKPDEAQTDQLAQAIRQLSKPDPLQQFPAQVYRRNVLINGGFDIWQRGTTNQGPNIGGYVADRFRCDWNGNAAVAISRQDFAPGQTDVTGEPSYFLRWQQTTAGVGATEHKISQGVESVRTLAGKTATVTFWARSDAARPLKVTIGQYFGNGGSEAVVKVVDVFALSTAWAKYSATFEVPVIAGKMLGTNDYLRLAFDLPLNVLQTVDLARVQLEEGPVSTPFEYRPVGEELMLCQRYFEKSFANRLQISANNGVGTCIVTFTQAAAGNTGQYGMVIDMQVQKRVQPTVVLYCPGNESGQVWNYSQGVACTGTTVQSVTQRSFAIGTVTPVSSQPGNGLQIEWTADAEI
ncbi:carbohydrate binding domain-containing protein [Pseudomonas sp. GM30]|uniref:carbohydrate binding domain-containing protein n=1 Tax=Pseudomonas sp. GM30 TaxID=1144328 RepID=UPI0002700BE2|nr:carbohydrate binding domain-containing protein [Pseudomonas sp. GM30]EUB87952.1 Carbohydrate-binding CenC domain protein [Pseudomonas sp. GM30]